MYFKFFSVSINYVYFPFLDELLPLNDASSTELYFTFSIVNRGLKTCVVCTH